PRPRESFVHRRDDDTLHWMLGDIVPPSLAPAIHSEAEQASEERLRLLYVACTRAMDLLVLPELAWSDEASWARAVHFRLHALPELDLTRLRARPVERPPAVENGQTPEVFAAEQVVVTRALQPLRWIHPSAGDSEVLSLDVPVAVAWDQP